MREAPTWRIAAAVSSPAATRPANGLAKKDGVDVSARQRTATVVAEDTTSHVPCACTASASATPTLDGTIWCVTRTSTSGPSGGAGPPPPPERGGGGPPGPPRAPPPPGGRPPRRG